MKVNKITIYAPLSLSALIAHFQNAIADSEYKEMIKIAPQGTLAFTVKISKAGTSTLSFTSVGEKEKEEGKCSVMLYKSDIAFLHKGYISSVIDYIENVVESLGGTVLPE